MTSRAIWNVHLLVHQLRSHKDFIPQLDGRIIGNIMHTQGRLLVSTARQNTINWACTIRTVMYGSGARHGHSADGAWWGLGFQCEFKSIIMPCQRSSGHRICPYGLSSGSSRSSKIVGFAGQMLFCVSGGSGAKRSGRGSECDACPTEPADRTPPGSSRGERPPLLDLVERIP